MPLANSIVRDRLAQLRAELTAVDAQAILIPSSDPHGSENLPPKWRGREWLSGFCGSSGHLAMSERRAALFVESHYWVQAERDLSGTGITIVKLGAGRTPDLVTWLASEVGDGDVVVSDGSVLAADLAEALEMSLAARGATLRLDLDVLDAVWRDRPLAPLKQIFEHPQTYAGKTRVQKIADLRQAVAHHGATCHLVSSLDDIAWLTNLRGADIECSPFFLSHMLIEVNRVRLFAQPGAIDPVLVERLSADDVEVCDYAQVEAALTQLGGARVLIDPKRVSAGHRRALNVQGEVIEGINPSTLAKSRKSETEIAQIKAAMAQDGAAMCAFYAWFESALAKDVITELTIDEVLTAERAKRPDFVSRSFPTIAAFNANGAMPHYVATLESHSEIAGSGLLLIDSGAQYLGATTDITRVWAIGSITDDMRRDFTRALKGTIALTRAKFPRGVPSVTLDTIARAALWAEGVDYGHGTGHGVGYFLCVHEGPQTFRQAPATPHMAMQPGMVTSIEPGLYRQGLWGVRIENLTLTVPATTGEETTFGEFLEFETLSLCPIDTRCIDRALMREEEIAWLNAYHAMVRSRLEPLVAGAALEWLRARTADF